jgi:hypothetical protein
MATDDIVRQIGAKAKKARERIPGVRENVKQKNARKIVAGLSAIDKDLEELIKLVNVSSESEEPPIDPPPPPPPPPDGGTIPGGWQVVPNKTFSGPAVSEQLNNLSNVKRRAYVNCTFQNQTDKVFMHGDCGDGVRFVNCTFRNLNATEFSLFFPGSHWATSNDDYGLKWINCTFENCGEIKDLFEFKCSNNEIVNCRFVNCKGGVRIRHGVGTKVINCTGLAEVKVRCGPHYIVNCPDTDVTVYSGDLPGENGKWQPLHAQNKPGGGKRQAAFRAQIANVRSVVLGLPAAEADKKYPAEGCNVAPGVPIKPGGLHRGTTHDPVRLP